MQFGEYLEKKHIDPLVFKAKDTCLYNRLAYLFEDVHPRSFTTQKLFLINKIRRKYPTSIKKVL